MKLRNILFAGSLLAVSATAGAAEFYTYVPQDGYLRNISLEQSSSGISVTDGVTTLTNQTAGQFTGRFATVDPPPADSFFRFFCAQINELTTLGSTVQYSSSILDQSVARYANIAKLYDVAYPSNGQEDFWNGAATNFGLFSAPNAGTKAAAFQVALWEIIYENSANPLDLAAGTFLWTGLVSSNIYTAAQAILAQVNGYVGLGYQDWTVYNFRNPLDNCRENCVPGKQDFISATLLIKTPEPGTLALFGLALVGLGAAGRRRRA